MENQEVRRFEGPQAVQELLRQMKIPVGQRPKIRIESRYLHKENLLERDIIVRNYVPKDAGKPSEHSVFHVADLFKSKRGKPLRIRFVWPPLYCDPQGKDLYPLDAVEVQAP